VRTVLIVDADLGFVFWLGQVLHVAGYAAFPARSVPEARSLIDECKLAVDVLVLDPSLPGAFDFVMVLRHNRENIKVVAVSEGSSIKGSRVDADATCDKPADTSEQTQLEWTKVLQLMLFEVCR
jgi:DNA-binding response OmpR family regulator